LSPVCAPDIAARLRQPKDLEREVLLRSYRADEWACWFAAAGVTCPAVRGPIFDSSVTMAEAAAQGAGVALVPVRMFERELRETRLVAPFDIEVPAGDYWLTSLKVKEETAGMRAFRTWLVDSVAASASGAQ
jgi:LysR family transcriptional regulator of beta-lactamase